MLEGGDRTMPLWLVLSIDKIKVLDHIAGTWKKKRSQVLRQAVEEWLQQMALAEIARPRSKKELAFRKREAEWIEGGSGGH